MIFSSGIIYYLDIATSVRREGKSIIIIFKRGLGMKVAYPLWLLEPVLWYKKKLTSLWLKLLTSQAGALLKEKKLELHQFVYSRLQYILMKSIKCYRSCQIVNQ